MKTRQRRSLFRTYYPYIGLAVVGALMLILMYSETLVQYRDVLSREQREDQVLEPELPFPISDDFEPEEGLEPWKRWAHVANHPSLQEETLQYDGDLFTCEAERLCDTEDIPQSADFDNMEAVTENSVFKAKGLCVRMAKLDKLALRRESNLYDQGFTSGSIMETYAENGYMIGRIATERMYTSSSMWLAMIPNAYVSINGYIVDCSRRFLSFSRTCTPSLVTNLNISDLNMEVAFGEGLTYKRLVVLDQTHAEQYFHYMIENFPKSSLIPKELIDDEDTFFFVQAKKPFTINMINALQLPMERVVFGKTKRDWVGAEMVYWLKPSLCHYAEQMNVNRLRARIYEVMDLNPVRQPSIQDSIVLIDRGNEVRNIANKAELAEAIKQRFPNENLVIFPNNASFNQTVKIFHKAKVIIGAHGAGLSNMIFSLAGTGVLEFMISKRLMCYHDLAGPLGMNYASFQPADAEWKGAVMHVDIDMTLEVIEKLLEYANTKAYEFPWKGQI
jgi:hypothetical protein